MRVWTMMLAVASAGAALAQTPTFEVDSVRRSVASRDRGSTGLASLGGDPRAVRMRNTTLWGVLLLAYDVKPYQIECPAWMQSEEYDISATAPQGTTKEQVRAMLQALLGERFRMKVHRETRERPVYALVVGKDGPKLKKLDKPAGGISFTMGGPVTELQADNMDGLVRMLSGFLDRPVLDMTGITGQYDIRLTVAREDLVGMQRISRQYQEPDAAPAPVLETSPAPSIFTAIQKLGLTLESRKAPIEFLVVDRAEKEPTEN